MPEPIDPRKNRVPPGPAASQPQDPPRVELPPAEVVPCSSSVRARRDLALYGLSGLLLIKRMPLLLGAVVLVGMSFLLLPGIVRFASNPLAFLWTKRAIGAKSLGEQLQSEKRSALGKAAYGGRSGTVASGLTGLPRGSSSLDSAGTAAGAAPSDQASKGRRGAATASNAAPTADPGGGMAATLADALRHALNPGATGGAAGGGSPAGQGAGAAGSEAAGHANFAAGSSAAASGPPRLKLTPFAKGNGKLDAGAAAAAGPGASTALPNAPGASHQAIGGGANGGASVGGAGLDSATASSGADANAGATPNPAGTGSAASGGTGSPVIYGTPGPSAVPEDLCCMNVTEQAQNCQAFQQNATPTFSALQAQMQQLGQQADNDQCSATCAASQGACQAIKCQMKQDCEQIAQLNCQILQTCRQTTKANAPPDKCLLRKCAVTPGAPCPPPDCDH